jgi:hypothetical protein
MHLPFNLLRVKSLYMFRTLLAHPQEALNKRQLAVCHSQLTLYARNIPHAVCEAPPEDEQVMFETCRGLSLQPCHSQLTLYARNIPNAVCAAPPEDEQVMFETCIGL